MSQYRCVGLTNLEILSSCASYNDKSEREKEHAFHSKIINIILAFILSFVLMCMLINPT